MLGISTSGYYAWRHRPRSKRAEADQALTEMICRIHASSLGIYGSPRIHAELKDEHRIFCGKKRVARLMRLQGIQGCHRRRKRRTTKKDPNASPVLDLLQRDFTADAPNRKWTADITYIETDQGHLYLAAVLDAFSRAVVGWSMRNDLSTQLVLDALDMAFERRNPSPGLIHHSDHGSQFTSIEFGRRCRQAGVLPSMGSIGDCFDNALSEAFFATLECELLDQHHFATRDQARSAVFFFIEVFYNRKRRHSFLGQTSPAEFERRHAASELSEGDEAA